MHKNASKASVLPCLLVVFPNMLPIPEFQIKFGYPQNVTSLGSIDSKHGHRRDSARRDRVVSL